MQPSNAAVQGLPSFMESVEIIIICRCAIHEGSSVALVAKRLQSGRARAKQRPHPNCCVRHKRAHSSNP